MEKKVVNLFALIILCIVPLIIFPWGSDIYTHIKIMTVYFLCIVMTLFYCIKLRKENKKATIAEYVLMAYFALIFLSTIFSVDFYRSIVGESYREEGFAAISCYVFIYFIISRYYSFSKKHIIYFILSAVIISFYGILQHFGFEVIDRTSLLSAVSTIGNPNFVGSYITLLLPITIFLFLYTEKKKYIFALSIMYLCMLCTYTRSAWVAFLIYISMLIYFSYKYKINHKNFLIIIPLFMAITIAFNLCDNGGAYNKLLSFYTDMQGGIENGGSNRVFIWIRGVKLIPERPLLGSGPDTFGVVFMDKYRNDVVTGFGGGAKITKNKDGKLDVSITTVDKAHNEYLQIAVTTGFPSLILYLIFITLILYEGWNNIGHNKKIIIPIFCSIVGYLVQAFFNISVVGVAPVYWALLGILMNLCKKEKIDMLTIDGQ